MAKNLNGKRVAVLVDNGFEQVELTEPVAALRRAGAEPVIVSPQQNKVKGWKHKEWGGSGRGTRPASHLLAVTADGPAECGG